MRGYALQSGDLLVVEGQKKDVLEAVEEYGLRVVESFSADDWQPDQDSDDLHLAELTLRPNSRLESESLRSMDFRRRYGLSVLALRHRGAELTDHFQDVPVDVGDSLLVQGPVGRLDELANNPDLMVLKEAPPEQRRTSKAPIATLILLGVIIAGAAGWLPVAAVMLIGAVLMVITGVLTMDEAYESIDWRAVFLIAGMLPMGIAMETTGTARFLAEGLVESVGGLGPLAVLAAVFVLTGLLTEVISNAAAAVLVVPIGIDVAFSLGANPEAFVMTVVIAASTSFLTPVGHQVNVLIMGAGDYGFFDYTKVGIGLNLLILLLVVTVLPLIWPLY
jgi:di/tricarboxylate transporter